MIHPTTHVVQAVAFAPGPQPLDGGRPVGQGRLRGDRRSCTTATSRREPRHGRQDLAGRLHLATAGPIRYYAWDRAAKKGTFLFVHQPKLEGLQLAEMKPVVIKSRDGLSYSYLTLPAGVEPKGLPMVLFVHGGPVGPRQLGLQLRRRSGSPTAATPCSRSTTAAPPATARSS